MSYQLKERLCVKIFWHIDLKSKVKFASPLLGAPATETEAPNRSCSCSFSWSSSSVFKIVMVVPV